MEFLHPEFLYFMILPLIILFGLLLTQKEKELLFFSDTVIDRIRVSANTLTIKARNALFFLASLLIVIALSEPVIQDTKVKVKAKSADIMMALDISDSMLAQDLYPNRLEFAKQKMMELLKIAPNERLSITAFAKNSYLVSPLSFDHSAVSFLLSELDTTSITEQGTDFLSMLEVVNNASKNKTKYLLLFSDGGDKKDFSQEITYAKEHHIVVFVLGVATKKGSPIKRKDGSFIKYQGDILISKLNEDISSLAIKSGGVYIQSVNSNIDIKKMIQEITHSSIKKELKSEEIMKYTPLFYYPLALALFILMIAMSSYPKSRVKNTILVFFISLFFFVPKSEAAFLDFIELDKAKEAYIQGEYKKSQQLYENYAKTSKNPSAYYNNANTLYKQKKYKEAINSYEKAIFKTDKQNALKYANIGNSYASLGTKDGLEKALEVYEKSLKLEEDKDTRENLEAVKKLLQQQKKNQKNQKKKQDNKKNNNNDKKKQKNKDNKNKDTNKKQENKKNKEKNDKKEQKKQSQKDKQEKSKKKEQENQKKRSEEKTKNKPSDHNKTKAKKQDLQQLKQPSQQKQKMQKKMMSEAEAQKWLQRLNAQKSTYIYQLNKTKNIKQDMDEKPW